MSVLNHKLSGSTLVETLVMMIVTGIIFLAVMDGLRLFGRLQAQRTEALLVSGRQIEGYHRFIALIAQTDSMLSPAPANLELYIAGRQGELLLRDSLLLYRSGGFCDTLLEGVSRLRLVPSDFPPDSVEIGIGTQFRACFPVISPQRQYQTAIENIEKEYGYEEDD